MSVRTGLAVPTLGYASQTAAIEALYQNGATIPDIISATGASVNSTYRAIARWKTRNGIERKPLQKTIRVTVKQRVEVTGPRNGDVWAMDENKRRAAFHARAVKAAAALRRKAAAS